MIKIKKMTETAQLPSKGSTYAAGFDLYADLSDNVAITPGETVMIDTGIAFELPAGAVGILAARSGLATKEGLALVNGVGVIDCDYRDSIKAAIHNYSNKKQTIKPFERVCQLLIIPCINDTLEEVDELSETDRGLNGFGSTGKA